ncbi:MAG: hypothetical protein JNJ47_00955 [Alphaproteobacteria bacterium]|nr:hypothetical protein [Alphaproteobacteria bacterium]
MRTSALKRIDAYEKENTLSNPHDCYSKENHSGWRDKDTSPSPLSFREDSCRKTKCPKISIAREEFVDLTQDLMMAMILNQLLYWSQRVKDFDLFLEEEKAFSTEYERPTRYGWFYKSAIELSEETMLRLTKVTMRKYLHCLIENGWISERANALNKWDRTTQYRVNLKNLHIDLQKLGWDLPGFPRDTFPIQEISFEGNNPNLPENSQNSRGSENEPSKESKSTLEGKADDISRLSLSTLEGRMDDTSKVEKLNFIYLTETTTEITNREHTQRTRAREDLDKNFFKEVLRIWNTCTNQEVHLTEERQHKFHSLLAAYFENDLAQWQSFCERVACSSFLMGQGARKWRVSLDWILVEENLLKVLEGNFDEGKLVDQKTEKASEDAREKEMNAILASIENPMWREWCAQLNFAPDSRESVSLWELKEISQARFLELEDDRLAWIGSTDRKTLSRIEDLRLKILPIVQRTFPKVRNLRIRLEENDPSLEPAIPPPQRIAATSLQHKGGIHYAQ